MLSKADATRRGDFVAPHANSKGTKILSTGK